MAGGVRKSQCKRPAGDGEVYGCGGLDEWEGDSPHGEALPTAIPNSELGE